MTTTAHEDQFAVAPEPVRQTYSTADILRRNVADLEIALKQQTERAEKFEAELAKLLAQKPVAWGDADGDLYSGESYPNVWPSAVPLYAAPVPAPAVPATYEIEEQLSLAETEMITATAWPAGSQSRIHIGFAMTAISCARALLQSAKVTDNAAADRLLESGE